MTEPSAPPPGSPRTTWSPSRSGRPLPAHLDPRLSGLTHGTRAKSTTGRWGRAAREAKEAGATAERYAAGLSTPLRAPRRIGVVGLKGGVGKTTASVLTANLLARHRSDPVLLVDADTTFGSLMLRTGASPVACAADVAAMGDPGTLDVLTGVLPRTNDGVWILPSGRNPEQSAAFSERTYVGAMTAVYRHFPLMVTDCGAGLASPLMHRVLAGCHSLVVATSPSLDGILATHNALQWLQTTPLAGLTRHTVVALMDTPRRTGAVNLEAATERFRPLCRSVVAVPHDDHLAVGSVVQVDALSAVAKAGATALAAAALEAALAAP